MDIGVPYRDYGPVDIAKVRDWVREIPEDLWTRNTFRQEAMADQAHKNSRAIIFKHEWHRLFNPWGALNMEDLIRFWGEKKGIDVAPFMPRVEVETDIGPVYTFREWDEFGAEKLGDLVEQAIKPVRTPGGIVTRVALIWLGGGSTVAPHVDGQPMAKRAHRLHVPILVPPGVEYKIGGRKLVMKPGRVYDFNNCVRHSVRHAGKMPRVNVFIDYYPNPGPIIGFA
jgi:hypothetical protein